MSVQDLRALLTEIWSHMVQCRHCLVDHQLTLLFGLALSLGDVRRVREGRWA
jgi:hypothetical protein